MSKYKDLKNDYDKLVNDYHTAIADEQYYKEQLAELQQNNAKLKDDFSRVQGQLNQLIGINNVNADVIQFLATRKFGDDQTIELAAIKTYRGWETLYLNGEELNPNGKDVTIWADHQEPVRIEVTG